MFIVTNKIEVNTSSLKGDVEEIAAELKALGNDADKLLSLLGQLETMWDGVAKQAFSAAVRDDVGRLKTLIQAMQTLTNKTSDARVEYDKCESAVSQIISSIRV